MRSQAVAPFPLLFMGVCVEPWGAAGWRLFSPMRVRRHLLPRACDFPECEWCFHLWKQRPQTCLCRLRERSVKPHCVLFLAGLAWAVKCQVWRVSSHGVKRGLPPGS